MKDLEVAPLHQTESPLQSVAQTCPTLQSKKRPAEVFFKTDTRQETIPEILERTSHHGNEGQAFYTIDLGECTRRICRWKEQLPRVEPFYAMKCNNNPAVLKTLADLRISFDRLQGGDQHRAEVWS